MKKYLLLRDNRESGPFSFEDLISHQLRPMDLVWVENESAAWQYPIELQELKDHVNENPLETTVYPGNNKAIFVAFPSNFSRKRREGNPSGDLVERDPGPVLDTNYLAPLPDLKERPAQKLNVGIWQKRFGRVNNFVNIAAVFIGLAISAFVIKKMVDGIGSSENDIAAAVPANVVEEPSNQGFQNALSKETIKPDTSTERIPVRSVKPKDIKRQVFVKANDYKVGVFGGISNLQLNLLNSSPHFIDRVAIAVEFLKPNGSVIESKDIQFNSVKPNSVRTLSIPSSRRGVRIQYRITGIYSKQYAAALKEI